MNLLQKPALLDGGMGRELVFRGVEVPHTIWSAGALITNPDVVRQIHLDYIDAGADIITTNTYGLIRKELAKEGLEDRFASLNKRACKLALEARDEAGRKTVIAGSLPPLRGSFRPDLVGPLDEIELLYREQADILAPHVDLFICETMSSGIEGQAAARAACQTGKPVWVSWTLDEDCSGNLRSGESINDAVQALKELPVSGYLANCCPPDSITRFLPHVKETEVEWVGGYANTFEPIPPDWRLDGTGKNSGLLSLRSDLDDKRYTAHVSDWLSAGANVVGGCCGTRPGHTAQMRALIDLVSKRPQGQGTKYSNRRDDCQE